MNKMIGVFGGTFDPIHLGHLKLAQHLLQQPCIDHIRLIPCKLPVHRDTPTATPEDRLAMLTLATRNEPRLVVDDCELKRQGASYAVDTLLDLKKETELPLAFIMGVDAWMDFLSWHEWERILATVNLIIMTRPHYKLPDKGKLNELLKIRQQKTLADLSEQDAGGIYIDDQMHIDLSSTAIREALKAQTNNQSLPDVVMDYIKQHQLY